MKTGCVALVLCLNITVDPPDVIKISPCARIEAWIGWTFGQLNPITLFSFVWLSFIFVATISFFLSFIWWQTHSPWLRQKLSRLLEKIWALSMRDGNQGWLFISLHLIVVVFVKLRFSFLIYNLSQARYKVQLDPTVDEVRKLCLTCRKYAKTERVLFHYNGHGVPKPTANGEIWVFNKVGFC